MHAWKGYDRQASETGPLACNLFFATHFFLRSFTSIVFRAVQGSSMPVDPKANTGAPPHHHSPMRRPHRPRGGGGKSLPHHYVSRTLNPHGAEAGFGVSSASATKASNYVEYCRPVPSSSIPQPLLMNPCGRHEVPVHVQGIASWRSRSRTAFQKKLSG
jgi:hypothetical protein